MKKLISILTLILILIVIFYRNKESVSCLAVNQIGFDSQGINTFFAPEMTADDRTRFIELLESAKERVSNTFGQLKSKPIIVVANSAGGLRPFFSNETASSSFVPNRVCIAIGPQGMNIDVISHELVHAEIFEALGFWKRLTQLPAWLDEGIAMQVDLRPRYAEAKYLADQDALEGIVDLKYGFQFYSGDDEELTGHYAQSKAIARRLLAGIGSESIYSFLKEDNLSERISAVLRKP